MARAIDELKILALHSMTEKAVEEKANDVVSKLLQFANTPPMKRMTEITQNEKVTHKKARGSVRADIFTYNAPGTVGVAYRNLAQKRRASYIRDY